MAEKSSSCLNCGQSFTEAAKYCEQCGQKTRHFDLSLKNIIQSFITVFFNVDNKVFQTIKDLYIPNKITRSFVQGNTKKYVHPFKTLFISLLLLFFTISLLIKDLDLNQNNSYHRSVLKMEQAYKLDSLADKSWLVSDDYIDSLKLLLLEKKHNPATDLFNFDLTIGNENLTEKYGITIEDALTMDAHQILDKYEIKGLKDRLLLPQLLRTSRDLNATIRFFINNMLWGIVLLLFMGSFIFYLLYIRHQTYYQEHVMLMANYFTISFLPIAILALFINKTRALESVILYVLMFTSLHFIYCIKQYFNEHWLKTIIKVFLLAAGMLATFVLVVVLIFLISLMLY